MQLEKNSIANMYYGNYNIGVIEVSNYPGAVSLQAFFEGFLQNLRLIFVKTCVFRPANL